MHLIFAFVVFLCASPAYAEATTASISAEAKYILNSFMFLIFGCLVMFMSAGFAMLEAGMVRYQSVATIILKNIALYAIAGVMFYLMGYNLMYGIEAGGYLGSFGTWAADDTGAIDSHFTSGSYAASADWFFQMVFVATAASIVSGAVAERIKLWAFLIFVVFLTAIIYPITGSWVWGKGWLDVMGFKDFAGSTLVHTVGGWAALSAICIVGARKGRFENGKAVHMPPSNVIAVGLGVFILWLGWFGFNGGSQLSMGSGADIIAISKIFVNTNMAAASGVISALIITQMMYGKVDIYMVLNGALAGLVSITADPLHASIAQSLVIGAVGAVIIIATTPMLERAKLDDVVGAVPVHLFCGIWGTLAVAWTNDEASLRVQMIGLVAVGAFTVITSTALWYAIKLCIGLRLRNMKEEERGMDIAELGISGLPYLSK
jgi:ammonium transporter, Amt family